MQARHCPFNALVNGATQFIIPVFQRDYSWEEEQCFQLWNDVLHAAAAAEGQKHFLGSFVYIASGETSANLTRWLLIDGQQRLTTLTLLLAALRDHIKETNWMGGPEGPTSNRIDAYFLQNTQEEGPRRPKLVLRRRDNETLSSLVSGGRRTDQSSPRVVDAYEQFRDLIRDLNDPQVIYEGVSRLVIVDVSLDYKFDDPQLVFESLNSTGVDLSQSDLVRNFILMRLPETEQTKLYNEYWSAIETSFRGSEAVFDDFLRDYLALRLEPSKQPKSDAIYANFRSNWLSLIGPGNLDGLLQDMRNKAEIYAIIRLGRGGSRQLQIELSNLRPLTDVSALLLMKLFDYQHENKDITDAYIVEAIRLIESYVLRRAVLGAQSRAYWQTFANIAYKLKSDRPVERLKVALAELKEPYAFPKDREFENKLCHDNLYSLRICRHVLERLENDNMRERSPVDSYSIEHIMPQTENLSENWRTMLGPDWKQVHETWLHRLGNLTLTAYNSELSAKDFAEKKSTTGGFSDSAARLNQCVREQSVWTEKQMELRGQDLAKRALKIWPTLVVDARVLTEVRAEEIRALAASAGPVMDVNERIKPMFESLRSKIIALDPNIVELPHRASVSYHAPEFVVEVIPRRAKLTLLLPQPFSKIENPPEIARDAADWRFFTNAQYSGETYVSVQTPEDVDVALQLIQVAYAGGS